MGPDQAVWALRIMARDRYSDRCWCWGERLAGQAIEYFEAEFHSPVLFMDRPPVSMVRSTSVQEGFARPTFMHSFFVEWKFACAQRRTARRQPIGVVLSSAP
jgi:hypothetical protein